MTQVAFVAAGGTVPITNGSISNLPFPTGVTDGDLCVAIIAISAPARTYSAPAGWTTPIAVQNSGGTNGPSIFISTHVFATGDATPTFTIGGTSLAGAGAVARMFAYRNAGSSITSGTAYTSGTTTGTSAGPITGVAVTGLGLALAIGAWAGSWTSAPATPSGWTVDGTQETTASTVDVAVGVFEKAYNGATSASVTIAGNTPAYTRAGVQIAIPEGAQAFSGSLAVSGSGTTSFGAAGMSASGSLAVSGSGALSMSGMPTASGSLAVSGSGALSMSGVQGYSGSLAVSGSGSLALAAAAVTAAGSLAVTGVGTVAFASNSGQGALTPTGVGTLTIAAAAIAVSGSLAVSGAGSLTLTGKMAAAAALAVNGAGALALSGRPATVGALAVSGVGTLALTYSFIVFFRYQSWNGTTWVKFTPQVWNGTAWVAIPVTVTPPTSS